MSPAQVLVPIFLLAAAVIAGVWFFLIRPGSIHGAMLMPYQYTQKETEALLPDSSKPEAFAARYAVIPDESVFYDANILAGAALIIDESSLEVLHSEQAFVERANASTTKLITLLTALKYGNLEDRVKVTADALNPLVGTGSSTAGLKEGDEMTLEQMLYALMLPSGNDAANAIAIHISGSVDAFCDLMNRTVRELGATHSQFKSPHGLDADGHYTTAYDLYLIVCELLKDPRFLTITGTVSYTATYQNGAGEPFTQTWTNSNGFLSGYPTPAGVTVTGGKTGTDTRAGACLVCVANGPSDQYIAVVLGSDTNERRYKNMSFLLEKIQK